MRLPLIALLAAALPAAAAATESPAGTWLTQGHDGVIEIDTCGRGLCGHVVGMSEPRRPNGHSATGASGQPICGSTILHAVLDTAGQWTGQITDPDTGSNWNATLHLAGDGTLKLRGYIMVPLLGQTQTWTRYTGPLGPDCNMSPAPAPYAGR